MWLWKDLETRLCVRRMSQVSPNNGCGVRTNQPDLRIPSLVWILLDTRLKSLKVKSSVCQSDGLHLEMLVLVLKDREIKQMIRWSRQIHNQTWPYLKSLILVWMNPGLISKGQVKAYRRSLKPLQWCCHFGLFVLILKSFALSGRVRIHCQKFRSSFKEEESHVLIWNIWPNLELVCKWFRRFKALTKEKEANKLMSK